MTPPRMRVDGRRSNDVAMKLLAGLQQLHAEVWVATSEASLTYIEIIDVLAKVGVVMGGVTINTLLNLLRKVAIIIYT